MYCCIVYCGLVQIEQKEMTVVFFLQLYGQYCLLSFQLTGETIPIIQLGLELVAKGHIRYRFDSIYWQTFGLQRTCCNALTS